MEEQQEQQVGQSPASLREGTRPWETPPPQPQEARMGDENHMTETEETTTVVETQSETHEETTPAEPGDEASSESTAPSESEE